MTVYELINYCRENNLDLNRTFLAFNMCDGGMSNYINATYLTTEMWGEDTVLCLDCY